MSFDAFFDPLILNLATRFPDWGRIVTGSQAWISMDLSAGISAYWPMLPYLSLFVRKRLSD